MDLACYIVSNLIIEPAQHASIRRDILILYSACLLARHPCEHIYIWYPKVIVYGLVFTELAKQSG